MKTINFELSKRLNDLGLLDNIETEYVFYEHGIYGNEYKVILKKYGQVLNPGEINIYPYFVGELELKGYEKSYKTLTLEEAIEFILNNVKAKFRSMISLQIFIRKDGVHYYISGIGEGIGETQIEAIENMLERLIDNNLLTK